MHIAVDASRITLARRTGTERYALALVQSLLALDTSHQFTLYFRDPPQPGLLPQRPGIRQRVIPFPRLWTHVRFAAELWRDRPDVTFVPAHALPLWLPGPALVTVHDLGYHFFPAAHAAWSRRYLEWSTPHSARRATVVLADSAATARDLQTLYNIPAEKVRVVYPGVDDRLHRVTEPGLLDRVRERYSLPDRYLVFLGTLQPRKNIERLVAAYAASGVYEQGVGLVLGGAQGWLYDPAWTAGIPGVQELGYVADEDIAALYSGALALVFPSLYEGFGFPVLEAMCCGIPVVASNTSSLPELTGQNAAIQVDPLSVESITSAIQRIVADDPLRKRLVDAGHQQVSQFTWDAAARATLQALEAAAHTG